jgi:hypothetical protein
MSPSRIICVSRGGVAEWYRGIANQYEEMLALQPLGTFQAMVRTRCDDFMTMKQTELHATEVDQLRLSRAAPEADPAVVIHPSVMYGLFSNYWNGIAPLHQLLRKQVHTRLLAACTSSISARLPREYFAIKLYASDCLPFDADALQAVHNLVRYLARQAPVVLLHNPIAIDDHSSFNIEGIDNVINLSVELEPSTNLSVQADVVSNARTLVCTYGGFSYLGMLLGVPTVSLFSRANYAEPHLQLAEHLARSVGGAPYLVSPLAKRTADQIAGIVYSLGSRS